ncbi:MAG: hypothetical protein SGI86_06185, partial [Deltaproteobacteria bacterium]|nr:hypothetical protein [Deltaproteobacteria bacterium]
RLVNSKSTFFVDEAFDGMTTFQNRFNVHDGAVDSGGFGMHRDDTRFGQFRRRSPLPFSLPQSLMPVFSPTDSVGGPDFKRIIPARLKRRITEIPIAGRL